MNPLVKKEIRLLLPSFCFCCALSLANLFFRDNPDGSVNSLWYVLAFFFCAAMTVMLALNSFGVEIGSGTFSSLLAQPVSRQKIWDTKILLLAVSFVLLGIIWCGLIVIRFQIIKHAIIWLDMFSVVGTFGVVAFSGGLWTVLLLRQVAAAFWFTVLVPGALVVILAGLLADESDAFVAGMIVIVLGLYSLAGFFFARWLFFRAQDVQWLGGAIAMPEMRGLARFKIGLGARRIWRPRMALLVKELQLHQAQFMLAGALAVLHLGVLATRHFGHFRKNSTTEFILESFWALWLVMPLLVGCAAVAEERKLSSHEGQLCLPAKRRTQFATKLLVALGLSVVLGVFMPVLLEGTKILPDVHFRIGNFDSNWWNGVSTAQFLFWNYLGLLNVFWPLLAMAGLAVLIGGISFYASTLARNTLQTLAPALAGIMAALFLILVATIPWQLDIDYLWHGPLPYFIVLPALVLTLLALAYRNYQSVLTGWKMGRRNLLVLASVLALTVTATSAIYHRAWEKLTPFEPPHGAARLARANPPVLSDQGSTLSVRLPDGRIWTDDYTLNIVAANPLALLLGDIRLTSPGGGHFYDGSNWVNVVGNPWRELAGIKTDGTLWVSEKPARRERLASGGWKMSKAGDLVRFGGETNWSSIRMESFFLLLVKNDGTLWRCGVTTNWNYKRHDEWPGLRAFTPERLGTESNWEAVYLSDYQPMLRKNDGSLWTTSIYEPSSQPTNYIAPGFSIQRAAYLEGGTWRSTTKFGHGSNSQLGIRDNGTFRIRADQRLKKDSNHGFPSYHYEWTAEDFQFGIDTNWLAVTGSGQQIVTLKDDGTLWLWNFYHDDWRGWNAERDERTMLAVKPVRLGTHSDWIGVASAHGGVVSLAADGSLWYWPLASARDFASDFGSSSFWDNQRNSYFEPWLDISRKPQPLGNVFGKSD